MIKNVLTPLASFGSNLVTAASDGNGLFITCTYDADGRQTHMLNRRGKDYRTEYYHGANYTEVDTYTPTNKLTAALADERGLPLITLRPSGKTVLNDTYDAEGRLQRQVIYPDTSLATALAITTMTYDTAGRLSTVNENNGQITTTSTRAYDGLSRLASYSDGETTNNIPNKITYTYDLANNLKTITYPGNKTVTYDYDSCNRLTTLTDWANRVTRYTYDTLGRLIKTERPNNTMREQAYDRANRLRLITERKPDGTLLWMRTLDYDADGRITKILTTPMETTPGTPAANANDTADYDADNRINTYYLIGPLSTPISFTVGGSNVGSSDPDGNMYGAPSANGMDIDIYNYDAHNRLTTVFSYINNYAVKTTYRYNPDGLCVQEGNHHYVIDPNASLSRVLMRDGTYYIWGANGLEYETDANGTYTKTYHADHLGSTMLLTDGGGNPTDYFEYDSYGNPTYRNGSTDTPFRWHGVLGCITDDNGLIYMRARYYNPRIMRFLNQDPIGFQGGLNWYAFVNGNPVSNVDPLGLCSSSGATFSGAVQNNPSQTIFAIHGMNEFGNSPGCTDCAPAAVQYGASTTGTNPGRDAATLNVANAQGTTVAYVNAEGTLLGSGYGATMTTALRNLGAQSVAKENTFMPGATPSVAAMTVFINSTTYPSIIQTYIMSGTDEIYHTITAQVTPAGMRISNYDGSGRFQTISQTAFSSGTITISGAIPLTIAPEFPTIVIFGHFP